VNEIQQVSVANLSTVTIIAVLIPAAA